MAIGCVQTLGTPIRTQITIPDNTGLGATIRSLIQASFVARGMAAQAAADLAARVLAVKIVQSGAAFHVAKAPDGVAVDAGTFTTHGQLVAAGSDYYTPADGDADALVRAVGAASTTAIAICFI